ncbi:MAG: ABC transporter ATP-binding protein [Actinomycetes bacterium]
MKLELTGITKRFGALVANDHIDLVVAPGEVHALLGENGAGKTTLMNVLYGLISPDDGQVLVDGQPVHFHSPADAIAAGIGMVHQHFMLIPVFTVAESLMLGDERTRGFGLLDRRRARRDVEELSTRFGLPVPPDALIEDLPVGVQQRVEILKALRRDASLLILDEPTAVLTPQEIEELFTVMRRLRDSGRSIVFITHKLKEVKAIADRITVIRRGQVVGTPAPSASESELASLMVGRTVALEIDKAPATPRDVVLAVSGLTVADDRGQVVVRGVDFQVRGGEILALAGVEGNGQTELIEALMGLRPTLGGSVLLDGVELAGAPTRTVLHAGVGYVPEDRQEDGLVGDFSVADNLVLDLYDQVPYAHGLAMRSSAVESNARERVAEFDVRTTSTTTSVGTLSGGNQQKVLLARELSRPLRLLLVMQPTRGLDVGSTEFVHRRIVAERDTGTAVVLASSELDEVLGLADRIAVMYRGQIVGERPAGASRAEVGLLMAGVVDQPKAGPDDPGTDPGTPTPGPDHPVLSPEGDRP